MADTSQRERITRYIQDTYGTQAEYLWADSPGNAIFRHSASKKWYAAMMRILPEKLGLTGEEALDVMDIKCSTIMIGSLLSTKGFLPAYHMNKNHWTSIVLDNSVPDDQITPLLELSYDNVAPKRRKSVLCRQRNRFKTQGQEESAYENALEPGGRPNPPYKN